MLVYACSTNAGKLAEFELFAAELSAEHVAVEPFPGLRKIPAPEETGATFEENASIKALYYSRYTPEVVLADDSGLAVDALDGAPGVYSARYAGPNATDALNNELLLRNLGTTEKRAARFICVIAVAQGGQILAICRGAVEGQILRKPRGSNGFGYDPLFFCAAFNRSFAELSPAEKFSVSHRGNALRLLSTELQQLAGAKGGTKVTGNNDSTNIR